MKRLAITLAALAARENLTLAAWKAARGKRERPAVARFIGGLDGALNRLSLDILCGRAPQGRFESFTIHDPKRRTIHAACFTDRVLHHAILNLAEPRFEKALVDSSYACRPGKGVHAAVLAVQRNLRRFDWCVQIDIASYFPSIDHEVLRKLLARRFKGEDFLALLSRIIDSGIPEQSVVPGNTPHRGLPIGALTSQHFANAYLDSADRWLLARADVRAHVRYMDDIVWWCDSRDAAQQSLAGLREYLATELKLTVKDGVVLQRSERGLLYCGFRIRRGVVLPSARKLSRYRAAAKRLTRAENAGTDSALLQRAHDGARGALAHTQSLGFRRRLWAGLKPELATGFGPDNRRCG
jgi:hypothetical protein